MKSKRNLLEQLESMPHFGKSAVFLLGKQLGLANSTINTYISRFLTYKEIIQLRRGLYVSADFFDKNRGDISYSFYLANIIRTPSYVSSWAALQYYNLATEAIYSITSVTPKVTRNYQIKSSAFLYQSIRKDLFSDYSLVTDRFDFFIASPSKALFDLLYFRTNQFRGISEKEIPKLVEGLRIDIDEIGKGEQNRFYTLIKKRLHG